MYEHLRGGLRNQIPKFQNLAGPITIYGNQYITLDVGLQMPFNPLPISTNLLSPFSLINYILLDLKRLLLEYEAKLFSSTPASGDLEGGGKDSKFKLFLNKGVSSAKNYLAQNADLLANMGMTAVNSIIDSSNIKQPGFMKGLDTTNNLLKMSGLDNTAYGKGAQIGIMGIKALGALTAKNIGTYTADLGTKSRMGGSYADTYTNISEAERLSRQNYAFGIGAGSALNKKNKAMLDESIILGIDRTSQDQLAMSGNNLNYLRYLASQNGGWNLSLMRSSKFGSKLERIRRITSKKPVEPVEEFAEDLWEPQLFKKGGTIEENIEEDIFSEDSWEPLLFLNGGKTRTIQELIEYAKLLNPRFILRLSEPPRGIDFIDDNGMKARGSHYLESAGEYVIPRILEVDGELKFFNHLDAVDRALETGNFLKMSPSEAILFAELYKLGWPEFFKLFLKGGNLSDKLNETDKEETNQKNIIPEGALHKEKHNMENAEDLTKKGIPVIDNDGVLLAEIERDEIVFTLEVTKKLEELYNKYLDASNKEKDELAIEAGRILVYEILYNTLDRTNLISKCKEGGKLNET